MDKFDFERVQLHSGHLVLENWMTRSISSDRVIKIAPRQSSLIGQLYLSYLLLDTLVWAHGWPRHTAYRFLLPVSPPASVTMNSALADVMNRFLRPPSTAARHRPSPPVAEPTDPLPDSESSLAVSAVRNFSLAHRFSLLMQKYNLMSMLHAVAFIVMFFRPVSGAS